VAFWCRVQTIPISCQTSFRNDNQQSQGQTLDSVGLYLPSPVFSLGQLYVALSRAKRPQNVKILIDPQTSPVDGLQGNYTSNVVYTEVLQD
jgi:hypothetical protein